MLAWDYGMIDVLPVVGPDDSVGSVGVVDSIDWVDDSAGSTDWVDDSVDSVDSVGSLDGTSVVPMGLASMRICVRSRVRSYLADLRIYAGSPHGGLARKWIEGDGKRMRRLREAQYGWMWRAYFRVGGVREARRMFDVVSMERDAGVIYCLMCR